MITLVLKKYQLLDAMGGNEILAIYIYIWNPKIIIGINTKPRAVSGIQSLLAKIIDPNICYMSCICMDWI